MLVSLRNEKVSDRKLETIRYLNEMVRELATIAKAERLDMPAYLLEMAYVELGDLVRAEHARRQWGITAPAAKKALSQ
jgi:hypothetical protein